MVNIIADLSFFFIIFSIIGLSLLISDKKALEKKIQELLKKK